MDERKNQRIYRAWAPVYDLVMQPVYGRERRRAIELLSLQTGEKVFIPGIGTGLDLPLLPADVKVCGIDLNPDMLAKAQEKAKGRPVSLSIMNAQALEFPDESFDAAILNLILSVAPDGAAVFQETWRVLRQGGRMVIFDKFLPEASSLTPLRGLIGRVVRLIGTDPNRRLSELLGNTSGLVMECNQPSLLNGQYRILLLRKTKEEHV